MPIEQVKLEIPKLKCPVPDTLSVKRGKIGLFRGRFARVEIWTSKMKPLCLCRKIGERTERQFFGLNEITLANDLARRHETQGNASGRNFGTLSKDEETALRAWREHVCAEIRAGKPPPLLSEIIENLIERERVKNETPHFDKIAAQFIEMKENDGCARLAWRERLKGYISRLAAEFPAVPLAEITEERLLAAIARTFRARDGESPAAPRTVNHAITAAKELFKWYFTRENKRRAREKLPALDNPIELLSKKKIQKTSEPETLSPAASRALLVALLEIDPAAVPVVAVQMFCGIRNAEALRLRWKDIRENEIFLSLAITKTSETRAAPVPENLRKWIHASQIATGTPAPESLIFAGKDTPPHKLAEMPKHARERLEKSEFESRKAALTRTIAKAARLAEINKPQNAFRHTAISAMCKIYGFEATADFCGHDIRTQGKHYRAAISKTAAQDYFGIMPPQGDGKAIAFDRSRAKTTAESASEPQGDGEPAQAAPAAETGKASA